MQFLANGPDIPNSLLQSHEDGKVVFFCGAGISYPAGLPGFSGLVKDVYNTLGETKSKAEEDTFGNGQYDVTLNLLEERTTGGRFAVRKALRCALQPKLRRKGAKETHSALLELASTNENKLHLVTTNFDLIFENLLRRSKSKRFQAPLLPVPHKSRWNGIVYLHGLLPKDENEEKLDELVVTSSDFGRAYLTERWASRFITELFRNYVVCFVGYSIEDPILRYMMDALAADRQLGQVTNQSFAFGSSTPEELEAKQIEWSAKGVTPILYETPSTSPHDHSILHQTLKTWANTYRDGIAGKLKIVSTTAHAKPLSSTLQDDYVGRLIWTLTDKTGSAAEHFADLIPPPSLDWLEPLLERRFGHDDLNIFSVVPRLNRDEDLYFSFGYRPAPYDLAAPMALIPTSNCETSSFDQPMFHLARWLLRHLNDPKLILRLVNTGSFLNPKLKWLIENQLRRIDLLKSQDDQEPLQKFKEESPMGVPNNQLQTLWELLLSNRIKMAGSEADLHEWMQRYNRKGLLTTALRLELREKLQLKLRLSEHFRDSVTIKTELAFTARHVPIEFHNADNKLREDLTENCLDEFELLLCDGLALLYSCSDYSLLGDPSTWDLPSIEPHWQNRNFHDWVLLIELLRDSWLALLKKDKISATEKAIKWFELPYGTFKRLSLFAASQPSGLENTIWVDWLTKPRGTWLWSSATKREVLRLIVKKGCKLNKNEKGKLERTILAGPPREIFSDELNIDWQDLVDRAVWLRLAKLESSGLALGIKAGTHLRKLRATHPTWTLEKNESDEFSHWMSGTGDPDWKDSVVVDKAPTNIKDLVEWLQIDAPEDHFFREDDWEKLCRKSPYLCIVALFKLSKENSWPRKRWDTALHAFTEDHILELSWNVASPIIRTMPKEVISEIDHSLSRWLEKVASKIDVKEDDLLPVIKILLNTQTNPNSLTNNEDEPLGEPVFEAINHPIGMATTALMALWFKGNPMDGDGLPEWLTHSLDGIISNNEPRLRHGKTIIAQHLIALYRVDADWTRIHLLPLFDWNVEDKTTPKSVWEGFLVSARIYPPLMKDLRTNFIDTAFNVDNLKESSSRYVSILTVMGLESIETYGKEDFKNAFSALPQYALDDSVRTIYESIQSAADRRDHYWLNRVQPFWKEIWPKSKQFLSQPITEFLIRTILETDTELPAATETLSDWIIPVEHPFYIVNTIEESGVCKKFPNEALTILDALISNQPWHQPSELQNCLEGIREAQPILATSPKFKRLIEYLEAKGMQ